MRTIKLNNRLAKYLKVDGDGDVITITNPKTGTEETLLVEVMPEKPEYIEIGRLARSVQVVIEGSSLRR